MLGDYVPGPIFLDVVDVDLRRHSMSLLNNAFLQSLTALAIILRAKHLLILLLCGSRRI